MKPRRQKQGRKGKLTRFSFLRPFFSSKGMTLVEVMIAGALSSLVILSLSQGLSIMGKQTKLMGLTSDWKSLIASIQSTYSNPSYCASMFQGVGYNGSAFVELSDLHYTAGTRTTTFLQVGTNLNGFNAVNIQIQPIPGVPSTPYTFTSPVPTGTPGFQDTVVLSIFAKKQITGNENTTVSSGPVPMSTMSPTPTPTPTGSPSATPTGGAATVDLTSVYLTLERLGNTIVSCNASGNSTDTGQIACLNMDAEALFSPDNTGVHKPCQISRLRINPFNKSSTNLSEILFGNDEKSSIQEDPFRSILSISANSVPTSIPSAVPLGAILLNTTGNNAISINTSSRVANATSGSVTINSTTYLRGDATIGGAVNIGPATGTDRNLTVNGGAGFLGDVYITGNTTIGGTIGLSVQATGTPFYALTADNANGPAWTNINNITPPGTLCGHLHAGCVDVAMLPPTNLQCNGYDLQDPTTPCPSGWVLTEFCTPSNPFPLQNGTSNSPCTYRPYAAFAGTGSGVKDSGGGTGTDGPTGCRFGGDYYCVKTPAPSGPAATNTPAPTATPAPTVSCGPSACAPVVTPAPTGY